MRKQPRLISQHLENISRTALEDYQDIVREYVRRRNGIYALYRKGKLYYVGLAKNLRSRLRTHLKDQHGTSWDRFSVYLTMDGDHMRELETLLLRIGKPTGNKVKGKFKGGEDLRRRLKKDIKRRLSESVDQIMGGLPAKARAVVRTTSKQKEGRKAILAEYTNGGIRLRAKHKGKIIKGRIRRDGKILFGGKLYTSPSLAARDAVKRRSANGWTFWKFERAKGEWVILDELRK